MVRRIVWLMALAGCVSGAAVAQIPAANPAAQPLQESKPPVQSRANKRETLRAALQQTPPVAPVGTQRMTPNARDELRGQLKTQPGL
ncbi:MAG: hypothetical protein RJB68_628 [Pseudomonadota bacterium]|jgi:hypothetical protein|uniref:Uncharacterized protein n=1 Tax=Rhodoferax potami TaxID=3068338 RepID=A0ABU3KHS8_9BURK|nr:hypothetical protein [Rhodoferax sp. TBRC 17660]MDT7517276.1 hypothetical protein [Rhodoferax sp. TBRC 17660]